MDNMKPGIILKILGYLRDMNPRGGVNYLTLEIQFLINMNPILPGKVNQIGQVVNIYMF